MKNKDLNHPPQKPKTKFERVMYAVIFEVLGISLTTPIAATLSDHKMSAMGVVTVVMAIIALLWNILFNYLFDRWLEKMHYPKTTRLRIIHAVLFELGLIGIAICFIMWWLNIGFIEAVLLDIGLVLFYLPYTYLYSLVYDSLRGRYWGRLV